MIFKKIIIFGLLFFGIAPVTGAVESNQVTVKFGDMLLTPEVKAVQKGSMKYINLTFLNKYIHVISRWDPDTGNIELRFGKWNFTLTEDRTKYIRAGVEKELPAPVFEEDDQLWLPVDFLIQFGLVVQKDEPNELRLDWADNYLLEIETVTYQNRPALLLIGSRPLMIRESNLIQKPDRLVVDLANVKTHPAFDNRISGSEMVKTVRLGVRNETDLRLVLDLDRLTGYRIIRDPNQEDRLTIVLNGFVTGLKFIQKGPVRKVQIGTSLSTEYSVKTVSEPNRIFIDLVGVTLDTHDLRVAGDGKWVSTVRVAQFDHQTVRVVLDLLDETPCYVIQPQDTSNLIEVRTVQTIQSISWSNDGGGQLKIAGDSELVKTVSKLKNQEQIQIDLNYFRFAPGLAAPIIKSQAVKGIQLITISPTKIRVIISLNEHVLYEIQDSKDQRDLVIRFRNSVLLNKVLVLDAGHGGVDPGACGAQGTREKDFTLDVVMRLKELLDDAGACVILTRKDDRYISLYERPMIANINFAHMFISIHCNSYTGDRNIRGIEIYYQKPAGKKLAEQVMTKLVAGTKLINRGVRFNNYAVLVETQMPSILVELGYLSNFAEETLLNRNDFKDNATRSIFEGIIAYCSQNAM